MDYISLRHGHTVCSPIGCLITSQISYGVPLGARMVPLGNFIGGVVTAKQ